jgi:hypothetical protein
MGQLQETTYRVEYSSNNSGGSWWLTGEDWATLEREGWTVNWLGKNYCNSKYYWQGHYNPKICPTEADCPGHRGAESYEEALASGKEWLGSLARDATIELKAYSEELAEGLAEMFWQEALPKQDPRAEGCNCCGQPHNFYARPVVDTDS